MQSLVSKLPVVWCFVFVTSCTGFFGSEPTTEPVYSNYKKSQIVGAPPIFPHPSLDGSVVPIDIRRSVVELTVDPAAGSITGNAKLWFEMQEDGFPFFDFRGVINQVKVNGRTVDNELVATIQDPDEVSKLRVLSQTLSARTSYTFEIDFLVPQDEWVKTAAERTDIFFYYNDFDAPDGRGFLGRYLPSNLEFDQYQLDMRIEVKGSSDNFQLFTNGKANRMNASSWRISFPAYFNSAAPFIHLTNGQYFRETKNFKGRAKRIPVSVYGPSQAQTRKALRKIESLFKHYEALLGPFPHERFVLRVHDSPFGMEYSGAALSHLSTIEHEFLHSWFGRYVFPASGNDGWIDEAIVSWLVRNQQSGRELDREITLSSQLPYNRMTPKDAYLYGASVMAELDRLDDSRELLPLILDFLNRAGGLVITTKDLHEYMVLQLGDGANDVFCKYVYAAESACKQRVTLPASVGQ